MDYHKVLTKRLKRIGYWLKQQRPDCRWKICVDTAPLLDKAWAEEAGLGWIGWKILHSKMITCEGCGMSSLSNTEICPACVRRGHKLEHKPPECVIGVTVPQNRGENV